MGLDTTFYTRSKLDTRYSKKVGYFCKVSFILTYFGVEEDDNCKSIVISKEKFDQFKNDLKKELGSHKGIKLPVSWCDETCIEPMNANLRIKPMFLRGNHDYNYGYWNGIRSLYRFSIAVNKCIDWEKDTLELHCWW